MTSYVDISISDLSVNDRIVVMRGRYRYRGETGEYMIAFDLDTVSPIEIRVTPAKREGT